MAKNGACLEAIVQLGDSTKAEEKSIVDPAIGSFDHDNQTSLISIEISIFLCRSGRGHLDSSIPWRTSWRFSLIAAASCDSMDTSLAASVCRNTAVKTLA